MGGRGMSSGSKGGSKSYGAGISGLDVTTKDGEKITYWFHKDTEGKYYYQHGISDYENEHPSPTPQNLSPKEFKKRLEQNGHTAKTLSHKQWEKESKEYAEERAKRPDYELGVGLKDNRSYRKHARRMRLMNRAQSRRL